MVVSTLTSGIRAKLEGGHEGRVIRKGKFMAGANSEGRQYICRGKTVICRDGEDTEFEIRDREVRWEQQVRVMEGQDAGYSLCVGSGEGTRRKVEETRGHG